MEWQKWKIDEKQRKKATNGEKWQITVQIRDDRIKENNRKQRKRAKMAKMARKGKIWRKSRTRQKQREIQKKVKIANNGENGERWWITAVIATIW